MRPSSKICTFTDCFRAFVISLFASHFVYAKKIIAKANKAELLFTTKASSFLHLKGLLVFSLPSYYDKTGVFGGGGVTQTFDFAVTTNTLSSPVCL